jgi:hypothetical protein
MDQPSRESRQHERLPVEFPVVLVCSHMGKARIEHGKAVDLSPGGIAVNTPARLRMEQPISLEFTVPLENVPLKVEAFPRYNFDGRYGFKFTFLSREQSELLKRLAN